MLNLSRGAQDALTELRRSLDRRLIIKEARTTGRWLSAWVINGPTVPLKVVVELEKARLIASVGHQDTPVRGWLYVAVPDQVGHAQALLSAWQAYQQHQLPDRSTVLALWAARGWPGERGHEEAIVQLVNDDRRLLEELRTLLQQPGEKPV